MLKKGIKNLLRKNESYITLEKALTLEEFLVLKKILQKSTFTFRISGKSMYPTLIEGNVVLIKVNDSHQYKESDLIVYFSKSLKRLILHRIVEIKKVEGVLKFLCKGDGNEKNDPLVETESVLGIYQETITQN